MLQEFIYYYIIVSLCICIISFLILSFKDNDFEYVFFTSLLVFLIWALVVPIFILSLIHNYVFKVGEEIQNKK